MRNLMFDFLGPDSPESVLQLGLLATLRFRVGSGLGFWGALRVGVGVSGVLRFKGEGGGVGVLHAEV